MSNAAPSTSPKVFTEIEQSDDFRRLKKKHRSFVLPVALLFLVWYFAYVLLADYAHDFMATPVFGNVNVGLLLGFGQFVTTFAITTWYVVYANRNLDPLAEKIRDEYEVPATTETTDTSTATAGSTGKAGTAGTEGTSASSSRAGASSRAGKRARS
jgi:uncharacterized membrane protein (DUF485 family)